MGRKRRISKKEKKRKKIGKSVKTYENSTTNQYIYPKHLIPKKIKSKTKKR